MYNAGYFEQDKKEYVITNMRPVRPLINYLWNEETVAITDHLGFGSAFSVTNMQRRMLECGERLIYVKEKKTGEFYSPNRNYADLPFDKYECHVGLGYQKVIASYKGLETEFTISVPKTGYCELYRIQAENTGKEKKKFSLYFYNRPTANMTSHTSYGEAYFDEKLKGLFFRHNVMDAEHEYTCLYLKSDVLPVSYDVCDERFKGVYGELSSPQGVRQERLSCERTTFEDNYAGALHFEITLAPGEKQKIYFAMGMAKDVDQAVAFANEYATQDFFERNLLDQKEINQEYLDRFIVKTPDSYINTMVNVWLKRQLTLGKTWGRIYGKGFRDVMQDIASFVSFDPSLARNRILYALKHQYESGNPIRMYEPDFTYPYHDGAAWIPATILAYIKESGDWQILQESVPYLDNEIEESVFRHVVRGLDFLLRERGKRGLVLWGGGDWNDSLNRAGLQKKGESVWLSIATVKALTEFLEILNYLKTEKELKERYEKERESLKKSIVEYGYNGEYFIYGYTDWDEKVGDRSNEEGQLYLNPQTWAVLADIMDPDKSHELMDVVEKRLRCDFGYVQCTPSYTKGDLHLGRSTFFMPGLVENGSVYNHGVAFKIASDCKLGKGDSAYETMKMMFYDNPKNDNSGVEPYAVSNMYIGPESPCKRGKAPMSWVTGTAGWLYRDITEYFLGVTAEFCGLKVKPCLPSSWDHVEIVRKYRRAVYSISVFRGKEKGLFLDGKPVVGDVVPYETGNHEIVCYI